MPAGPLLFLVLLIPACLFYYLFKKHWVDSELQISFFSGIVTGFAAILVTRLAYLPVEMHLGTDLRSFISSPRPWWITLLTSICIIGFIEEFLKAAAGYFAAFRTGFMKRPTVVFMGFAGCALSFSFAENFQYYTIFGAGVVLPRILISSSAHLFFSTLCAAVGASALSGDRNATLISARIFSAILLAALVHGLFDFMVFHFDIQAASGIVGSMVAVFFMGIYESWIAVLKIDQPEEGGLTICTACSAFSIEKSRFCGFCGNRVMKSRRDFSIKI